MPQRRDVLFGASGNAALSSPWHTDTEAELP
jgi:hypothetical protein